MLVTIIKDRGTQEVVGTDHILNSQKLILSTALQRFHPFQYVLVPFGTSTSHAICQVIKKPDLHQGYCYVNANVVCNASANIGGKTSRYGKAEAKGIVNISGEQKGWTKLQIEGQTSKPGLENVNERNEPTKELTGKRNVLEKADVKDSPNIIHGIENESNDSDENYKRKTPEGNSKPNVFEEFTGSKIDLDSVVQLSDEVVNCKNVTVGVVLKEKYAGTKDNLNKLVKQILSMYTFTSSCYINVHLENIHSIVIHTATPYTPKSKSNQSKSTSNATPSGKKSSKNTYTTSPNFSIKSENTRSTLTPSDECTPDTVGALLNQTCAKGESEELDDTLSAVSKSSNPDSYTLPKVRDDHSINTDGNEVSSTSSMSSQVGNQQTPEIHSKEGAITKTSQESQELQKTYCEKTRSSDEYNRDAKGLFVVTPKTKLVIERTYSADYYKQLIKFGRECEGVSEYARWSEAWRSMQQLIRCRQRGQERGEGMNSANKILLIGPSGSGKTYLMKTLARACHVPLVCCHGNQFSSPSPGVAEHSLSQTLTYGHALAEENKGICIVLLEQIHELAPLSSSHSHITRLSLQLTDLLDSDPPSSPLFFVFNSTAAHQISPRLKYHAQIYLTAPGLEYRRSILDTLLRPISVLELSVRRALIEAVVGLTGSYLPVDLVRVAGMVTMYLAKHGRCSTEDLIAHIRSSLAHYRPSCLKAGGLGVIDLSSSLPPPPELEFNEGEGTLLRVEGEEIRDGGGSGLTMEGGGQLSQLPELGGMKKVRTLIEKMVEWPFKYGKQFERLGIPRPKGILLYGPPGCGKTALVRSLGLSSSCRVLATTAAQLYSPYVGEAEHNVAQLFYRARLSAPAILFIDEIDALVGNRSEQGCKDVQQSVLSVFLNEMDGVGLRPEIGSSDPSAGHILVIAATNRPHMLDSALVRPGRLDRLIYVRPPDEAERVDILVKVGARGARAAMEARGCDVDWGYLGRATENYSGADLCNLYREAALISILDQGFNSSRILQSHWLSALDVTRPSLTSEQLQYYEDFERTV